MITTNITSLLDALREHERVPGLIYSISTYDVAPYLMVANLEGLDAEALACDIFDAIGEIGILEMVVTAIRETILAAATPEPERDDPMDGDHESALASAGHGMDEDYGCFDAEGDF